MSTIKVHRNYHWKALQLRGPDWHCIACAKTHATNLVEWSNDNGEVIFTLRYCNSCLPEILVQPPLDLRLKSAF